MKKLALILRAGVHLTSCSERMQDAEEENFISYSRELFLVGKLGPRPLPSCGAGVRDPSSAKPTPTEDVLLYVPDASGKGGHDNRRNRKTLQYSLEISEAGDTAASPGHYWSDTITIFSQLGLLRIFNLNPNNHFLNPGFIRTTL